MKFYAFLRSVLKVFFKIVIPVEIEGKENVPESNALLVAPNHISNWDPFILAVACDTRKIKFMAKASLFKIPVISSVVKALGAFPVHRGEADPSALKCAITHLKNGGAVGMFPQGTRCMKQEPKDTKAKAGVGMIAYRSKADVLPISIKTKNYKIMPFRKVYIKIGKVISNDELNMVNGTQQEYVDASNYIFDKVLELIGD